MRKVIRTKNTLHQRNQEINTATRKISINLENSTVLQNKKNKTTFDVAIVEPIRNEDTQERRQSQTVIVPDTQETDDQLKIQLKTYNELGTESLKFRRWFRQLCVFYKIKTTQIPKY